MRISCLLASLALACAFPALAQAPPTAKPLAQTPAAAPKATLLSVKAVMRHIVNPAAETYWTHSGEVDDEKGANDRIPTSQAEWNINIDTAAQIAEAGNLAGRGTWGSTSTNTASCCSQ